MGCMVRVGWVCGYGRLLHLVTYSKIETSVNGRKGQALPLSIILLTD